MAKAEAWGATKLIVQVQVEETRLASEKTMSSYYKYPEINIEVRFSTVINPWFITSQKIRKDQYFSMFEKFFKRKM